MTRSDKNGAGKREAGGQRSFGPPGNGAGPKPPATFVINGHFYIDGRECLETMTRHPGPNHPMLHAYLPLLFGWRYLVFVRRCRQAKFPQPYVRVFLLPLAPINLSPFHAMRGRARLTNDDVWRMHEVVLGDELRLPFSAVDGGSLSHTRRRTRSRERAMHG